MPIIVRLDVVMARRKERAHNIPALTDHMKLLSVVEAMCDLFMGPIRPVIDKQELS